MVIPRKTGLIGPIWLPQNPLMLDPQSWRHLIFSRKDQEQANGHTTLKQRGINVAVDTTLYKRHVPAGYFSCNGSFITYRIRPNYRTYPYKRTVKKFRSLQIIASVLFLYFFMKAYVVGTHLNCIDLSMQFKWAPTTYAFIKKVRKNRIIIIKQVLFWSFLSCILSR